MSTHTTPDDGGPVHPGTEANGLNSGWSGLSLRDEFAGRTLTGLLSDIPKSMYGLDWKQTISRECYEMADAMLAARKGGAA